MVAYWLMKSEPHVYPWEQLVEDGRTHWDGVRNYQARNFLRDQMSKGDLVLFYNSNCEVLGVGGIAVIENAGYPDPSQFDKTNKYFDEKSTKENPRWYSVDIKQKKHLKKYVPLSEIKETKQLKDMKVVQRGQRLSIQPVTKKEFEVVCKLGGITAPK